MTRLQIRRGTTTQWTNGNPILAAGEPGLDITTGNMKVGDGITNWNSLAVEWAPASMFASAPRGVVAVGVATDGITLTSPGPWSLTSTLTYNFNPARRYRIWYVVRAITAGFMNFALWNQATGASPGGGDMWLSADRSYGGTTVTWLVNFSGSIDLRIRTSTNFTANMAVYGRDFYIEDVGAYP